MGLHGPPVSILVIFTQRTCETSSCDIQSCGWTRDLNQSRFRCFQSGEVSEWLKEHAWKACVGVTLPRVRIPPSPLLPSRSRKPHIPPPQISKKIVARPIFRILFSQSGAQPAIPDSQGLNFANWPTTQTAPKPRSKEKNCIEAGKKKLAEGCSSIRGSASRHKP